MGRWFALGSEILTGQNDATAEEAFPKPVGRDACGKWVILVDKPAGQLQPVGRACDRLCMEDARQSRFDCRTLVEIVAPVLKPSFAAFIGKLALDRHSR